MFLLQIFSSISISKISSSASLYGEEAIAAMGIVLRIVTLGTKDILKYELFQKRFLLIKHITIKKDISSCSP
ncbi:Uncharacterised protein [Fusobacterium necrophorum subsp. necrophorum]|nr:Uncharacterised protein [Fusobacterium necrophorum subsp. necrophorum]